MVYTYKVQFSNDSLVWKSSMNGTEEAVSELTAPLNVFDSDRAARFD